jgi:hypothetical protein
MEQMLTEGIIEEERSRLTPDSTEAQRTEQTPTPDSTEYHQSTKYGADKHEEGGNRPPDWAEKPQFEFVVGGVVLVRSSTTTSGRVSSMETAVEVRGMADGFLPSASTARLGA